MARDIPASIRFAESCQLVQSRGSTPGLFHEWGSSVKKTAKVAFAGVALSAAVTAALAAPAQAWVSVGEHVQHPSSGGTWSDGFWNIKLRSYYTVNRCHGSTVIRFIDGRETSRSRSIDTASNQRSIAEINTVNSPGLEAQYFYRTC